jgi:hypothetical protein
MGLMMSGLRDERVESGSRGKMAWAGVRAIPGNGPKPDCGREDALGLDLK